MSVMIPRNYLLDSPQPISQTSQSWRLSPFSFPYLNLGTALLTTARDQPLDHLDTFASSLDAALVTQALEAPGGASVRRRKLPAERAAWLMLGMALVRDRSIQTVCDHLHLVLPDHTGKTIISSAFNSRAAPA